jgi:hypothetical protein
MGPERYVYGMSGGPWKGLGPSALAAAELSIDMLVLGQPRPRTRRFRRLPVLTELLLLDCTLSSSFLLILLKEERLGYKGSG